MCFMFEFSSSNGGSMRAVPVDLYLLLYLCFFSPTHVASVVVLGTVFPTFFQGP